MKRWVWLVPLAAWALALGCENNSDVDSGDSGTPSEAEMNAAGFGLSPSGVHLGSNETVAAFTVQNGEPPYQWSLTDTNSGSLVVASPFTPEVRYKRASVTTDGANAVSVRDNRGWTASALVVQDQE